MNAGAPTNFHPTMTRLGWINDGLKWYRGYLLLYLLICLHWNYLPHQAVKVYKVYLEIRKPRKCSCLCGFLWTLGGVNPNSRYSYVVLFQTKIDTKSNSMKESSPSFGWKFLKKKTQSALRITNDPPMEGWTNLYDAGFGSSKIATNWGVRIFRVKWKPPHSLPTI